ncbi:MULTISPECIES: hypothetical protein [Roseobacteraceae]|uniref:hypothetical protein n=1 Tax=Roseobacteraceae TaxID=2854170 RepID=UPI00125F2D1A|nr:MULTISPECIES: hypothetical protein [Roseobacteraceae]KAB6717810.1 hypothetical protein C8029_01230 [Roseobacter sp. TSBP12]
MVRFSIGLGVLPLCAMPFGAVAQAEPLFQCTFANGKTVVLETDETGVVYRFGRPGQTPELTLHRLYDQIDVTPWPGVGRSIWEDLSLHNGAVTYRLWGALDRMSEDHELSAGLIVEQGEDELARLECLPDSINYAVFSFSDAYEAAGYCWNYEGFIWQEACE